MLVIFVIGLFSQLYVCYILVPEFRFQIIATQ